MDLHSLNALLGPLAAFLASVSWAIGSAQYSKLTTKYSASSLNFTRALVSLPFFILATILVLGSFESVIETFSALEFFHFKWAGLSILASYGVGDIAFLASTALIRLPAALAIASTSPVWTILAQSIIDHKPIGQMQILGLLITVAGIIIVVISGSKSVFIQIKQPDKKGFLSPTNKGYVLAIFASFCWAMNNYSFAKLSVTVIPPLAGLLRMSLGLVVIFFMGQHYRSPKKTILPPEVLKRFLPLFIAEAFLGTFFMAYGLKHSSLPVGATLISLAPVVSVPISVIMKLEKFSFAKTVGVIMVVMGICLLVGAFG